MDRAKTRFTKRERSWIMYDWANSVYATIMMAAVFNVFFTGLVDDPRGGDFWWSIATTLSALVTAILAPIIGGFADYSGNKKKLFTFFFALGITFTALCAFTTNWHLLMVAYIFSYIGFAGANVLYDSFLPDVTTEERMDMVSGWGYAMGYIGGSTIPFIVSIALIQFAGSLGITATVAVKISIIITALWWLGFTFPFLKNVSQLHHNDKPRTGVVSATFKSIGETFLSIAKNRTLLMFVIAYFFYIDGVGTIIHLATSYGTQLGLGTIGMILALLVTQLVAFPFSIWFSKFAKKIGSVNMLTLAVALYVVICIVGFFMGYIIEAQEIPAKLEALRLSGHELSSSNLNVINQALIDASIDDSMWNTVPAYLASLSRSQVLFWVLATMVGMVQGGIQALSRSYFGKLTPKERSGEYFGFFDIFGKFAAVVGPALYALIKGITGRSSFSILSIILLFIVGFIMLLLTRREEGAR